MSQNTFMTLLWKERIHPYSGWEFSCDSTSMQLLSEKTFLMFCTLNKAVDWGDKKVQVIILFSVKRNNNEDLQKLYDFLYDIMSNQNTIEKLAQAEVVEDFQEILLSL